MSLPLAASLFMVVVVGMLLLWRAETQRRIGIRRRGEYSVVEEIMRRVRRIGVYAAVVKGEHWLFDYMKYWAKPSLDACYFAYMGLQNIDKLTETTRKRTSYVHDFLSDHGDELRRFVDDHFDDSLGGFKHSKEAPCASLYGTYHATSLYDLLWQYALRQGTTSDSLRGFIGEQKIEAIQGFIKDSCTDSGTYCESKYFKDRPTCADTNIALRLTKLLGLETNGSFSSRPIMVFFKVDPSTGDKGFANLVSETQPYSCATHFGINASWAVTDGDVPFAEEVEDIRDFILRCKRPDGGYSATPNGDSSLPYTYLALSDLQNERLRGTRSNRLSLEIDIPGILDFVASCKVDDAFKSEPTEPHPVDVHGTRAALGTIRHVCDIERLTIDDRRLRGFKVGKTADYIIEHLGDGRGAFKGM